MLDREGQRALAQLAAVIPDELTTADPVDTFATIARGFFDAALVEPARWRSILLPVEASPPPVRKHKQRSEALVREHFADNTRYFLRDRPGAEDIDVDLLANVLLNALEEGGRLLLRAPEEYPPERITAMARFLAETLIHRYPAASS